MFYFTYVLECELAGKYFYYIGFTNDLVLRVGRHKSKKVYATKKYEKVKLVYYESCLSEKDAILREKSLKVGFGRAFVKNRLKYYLQSRV